MSQKRSILVSHSWMGRGGSEATAMWTLEALQDDYEVTFVTASPLDWNELNGAYGSHVDPEKVKVIRAPALPTVDGPSKLVLWQQRVDGFEHTMHFFFGLAYREAADGDPGGVDTGDKLRRLLPQIIMDPALHNTKQGRQVTPMRCFTAFSPAQRYLHGFHGFFFC